MKPLKQLILSEFFQIAFALMALLIFGYFVAYPWIFFSAGLIFYLFLQFRQLTRLIYWLSHHELEMPPEATGLWGEVFRHLYRIQRHNRQRQEKLISHLNRYRQSTEAMPDATMILKQNWVIEWFNSKASDYFSLERGKDTGKILTHLLREPSLLDFLNKHHETSEQSLSILSPDKKRFLSIRLIPYGDKYLLVGRDVTEVEKLKSMRKVFVSNVSHELRTPLTVISGYLETLADHLTDRPELEPSIQLMQQQSNRMCSIVEDLLLLSQVENSENHTLTNEYVDMSSLLLQMKKEAQILSAERHDIVVELDNIQYLKGDHKELQSAFTNLISNAIRYTPDNGTITISWKQINDKEVSFSVQDSGEGIATHHLERLTERFYRIDVGRSRTTGGTGLGLAIVKHVMNHHNGLLQINSKPGKGAIFSCIFPIKMTKNA